MTRTDAVALFRSLHRPGQPLVMPNPWDIGSAKLMIRSGARAIATTSSGFAFTLGHPDGGHVTRDQMLDHSAALAALGVPVNGDFENCYGHDPDTVAETVRLAAEAGLAGVSVEDTVIPGKGSYPFEQTVDRVRAAVEAAREVDIVLTARADGVLAGSYDEAEAIRRCRAFAEAGAEVIYAPIVSEETNRALAALGPAVNVLTAGPMARRSVPEFAAMGAARISIGGSLARVTHRTILDAMASLLGPGDLGFLKGAASSREIDAMLGD